MTLIITYMLIAVLISAICSVSESCLSSTPMTYVSSLGENKNASLLRSFKENMDKPLSAILIINTIANTVGASIVGSAASSYAAEQGWNGSTFIGIISGVFTILVLMFAEILPKTIGANYWRTLIIPVTKIINGMIYLTYPIVKILGYITQLLSNDNATSLSREEITATANEGAKEGVINSKENKLIQRVLKLRSIKAQDIMTPALIVKRVYSEDECDSYMFDDTYSRIPVMTDNDCCIGYILKDELPHNTDDIKIKDYIHNILTYNDETSVSDIFDGMVESRTHISAIVDEYGTFRGIVTLEDVIETILGIEIVDETDIVKDLQEYAKEQFNKTVK